MEWTRDNKMISEIVIRNLEDAKCSLDIVLAWPVNANNSLHNIYGFTLNQLLFGPNPNLSNNLVNRPSALKMITKVLANNLEEMHNARKAFIENEVKKVYSTPGAT